MKKASTPRAVVVTRPTEYESLHAEHATRGQVEFFLRSRGQSIDEVDRRHELQVDALSAVRAGIPLEWRRAHVLREQLDRFLFGPEDVVIVVGQDGLVANVAKYLNGQPVVGINPDPSQFDGVLVRHDAASGLERMVAASRGRADVQERPMVEARTDSGRRLVALNEVFVGHRSHQSARYHLRCGDDEESHSSSGLIVASGTGSTGWARSIHRQRGCTFKLPEPTDPYLSFFVREAFPSRATGCSVTDGILGRAHQLEVTSRMSDGGVIFGDGIESDRIEFNFGRRVVLSMATQRLRLVV